jgi:hypothetical protein
MIVTIRAAVLLLALVAAGCGDSGRPAPRTTGPAAPAASNPREEAAALAARGDDAAAERKYREALQREPEDVDLHFGLGSVLSQLDRGDEAAEEFRWVVKNGPPGRPEVDTARRWLADADKEVPSAPGTTTSPPASTASAEPTPAGETGTVSGKLTWPGIPSATTYAIRIMIQRDGVEPPVKYVRSKLNGTYTLDLPEGRYRLTGLAGPVRVWSEVPVTVNAGRQTALDLTPANAVVSPSEFPAR